LDASLRRVLSQSFVKQPVAEPTAGRLRRLLASAGSWTLTRDKKRCSCYLQLLCRAACRHVAPFAHLPMRAYTSHLVSQRRRTSVDELNMRTLFEENDLISVRVRASVGRASARSRRLGMQAEVQSFFSDGGVALHTRSAKYGRLSRGQLVCVPPVLIKRLKQHFCTLAAHNVDVVLGCNGWVWVQARASSAECALNKSDSHAWSARRKLERASPTQSAFQSMPTQMPPLSPPPLPLHDPKMLQTLGMPKPKPAPCVRACALASILRALTLPPSAPCSGGVAGAHLPCCGGGARAVSAVRGHLSGSHCERRRRCTRVGRSPV